MTLLAFAFGTDSVVMGADSGFVVVATREPPRGLAPHAMTAVQKIQRVSSLPLYWAICGDGLDYESFAAWIDNEIQKDLDWQALGNLAAAKSHALNPDNALMIVGKLQGSLNAVVVEADERRPLLANQFGRTHGFAGVFGPTAEVAWQSVKTFNQDATLSDPRTMEQFIGSLCGSVAELGEPVSSRVVKLNPGDKP
jgi:hypothetical protein